MQLLYFLFPTVIHHGNNVLDAKADVSTSAPECAACVCLPPNSHMSKPNYPGRCRYKKRPQSRKKESQPHENQADPSSGGTCRFSADSHETLGTQQTDRLIIGTNTRAVEPQCDALFPQIVHMVPVRCGMVRLLFLFFSTSVTVKPYRPAPAPHRTTPSKTTCREHAD
ncbi:unnamed protein product [Ectocarpus sp. 12 AP-2014]